MLTVSEKDLILRRINHWLEEVVIGLKLCPFAGKVYRDGLLDIRLLEAADVESCLQEMAGAAEHLSQSDPQRSSLIVLPAGFEHFDDYLDLVAIAEDLLADRGFEGVVQLASFHPDYCFADAALDDPGNWTNRSPYPILHLLNETGVEQAIESHPDPESIPKDNIERLSRIGIPAMQRLMDM